jgi:hypothetical protein
VQNGLKWFADEQDASAGSKEGAENSLFFSEFVLRKSVSCDTIILSLGENLPLIIPHLQAFCAVITCF